MVSSFGWSCELDSWRKLATVVNECFFLGCENGISHGTIQRIVWSENVHCNNKSFDSVHIRLGERLGVDLIRSEQSAGVLDGVVFKIDDSIPHGFVPEVELCNLWGVGVVLEADLPLCGLPLVRR